MLNKKIFEDVGKYIDKYYVPEQKDEMRSSVPEILEKKRCKMSCDDAEEVLCESSVDKLYKETDASPKMLSCKSKKSEKKNSSECIETRNCRDRMHSSILANRKIDDLIDQIEETFSQRLLRMIDERGMTDSQAYNKAYVDRRHFSKIRNDINYAPSKKVVLAFSVALELSLDEAKDLLGCAGFALSRSSKTDIIIAYCLQHHIYDMFEINDLLEAYEQPLF